MVQPKINYNYLITNGFSKKLGKLQRKSAKDIIVFGNNQQIDKSYRFTINNQPNNF